jgi:transposase-like protein
MAATSLKCTRCRKPLLTNGPRIVIAGRFVCGDCAYQLEKDAERQASAVGPVCHG